MYIFFQIHILTRVLIIWKIETQKKNLFYFIKSKYRVINSIQCRIYIFILFLEFDYIDYDFVPSPLPSRYRYNVTVIDQSIVPYRYSP